MDKATAFFVGLVIGMLIILIQNIIKIDTVTTQLARFSHTIDSLQTAETVTKNDTLYIVLIDEYGR